MKNAEMRREIFLSLLEIKDSDIRNLILKQGKCAIDKSIHIGGAFSITIPMIALFYSGCMHLDIENPTSPWSDKFVLSKGHAIATMAAIFSDLGYFGEEIFHNARSFDSVLNAHPGPILPGVHISTGPLGQGISAAVGFAQEQSCNEYGKVYCCVGDGEVQEGIVWEAAMYAGANNLKNLCVLVDYNNGQNDDVTRLMLPIENLQAKFEAFGFHAVCVNARRYDEIVDVLWGFSEGKFDKPLAVIGYTTKGEGGFSEKTTCHKTSFSDTYLDREIQFQIRRREKRVLKLRDITCRWDCLEQAKEIASTMNLQIVVKDGKVWDVLPAPKSVKTKRAEPRDKSLKFPAERIPQLEIGQTIPCDHVLSDVMEAFGHDDRIITVDADMGNITGLNIGMSRVNRRHAFNVGIAESNMMGIAEGFAACGYNVWCGTFGMFLDWRVLRRIAVSQQERQESIEAKGWLNEGHGLDITFVCAAANLDTQTNGATHISIDDANALKEVPHIRIIDVACPQMLIAVSKWIAQGNRGLVILRMTRAKTRVIYGKELEFEYGKGYAHGNLETASVAVVTSGRGIYEALEACAELQSDGIPAVAIDMPSYDSKMLYNLTQQNKRIVFAEQNNGILFDAFLADMYAKKIVWDPECVLSLSTRGKDGSRRFLHSATYAELAARTGLDAVGIIRAVKSCNWNASYGK